MVRTYARDLIARLVTWLRSLGDRLVFVVRGDVALAISALLATFAVLERWNGLPQAASASLAGLGVAGGVGFLIRDIRRNVTDRLGWEFTPRPEVFRNEEVLSPALPERVSVASGSMMFSLEVNHALGLASTHIEPLSQRFKIDGWLRVGADKRLREIGPRSPFNGHCVRLGTDLSASAMQADTAVRVARTRYFDALCSNQMTRWRVTRDDQTWPFHERYLFEPPDPAATGHTLMSLAASQMANIVGVSSLAITRDDRLVLVKQSPRSASSPGMWAPSGSGSLEPRDVSTTSSRWTSWPDAGASTPTLQEVVTRGAVRELREECALPSESIGRSRVIGHGRWLEHGGKPEFVVVTALDVDSSHLSPRPRWRFTESVWTQSVRTGALDFEAIAGLDAWASESDLLADRVVADADLSEAVSLPLEFGLRCLVSALQHDPTMLTDLRSTDHEGGV